MSFEDAAKLYDSWPEQKKKEFNSLIGKSLKESLNPKQSHIDACKKYFEAWKLEQSKDPYSDATLKYWHDFFSESLFCTIQAVPMYEEAREIMRVRKK